MKRVLGVGRTGQDLLTLKGHTGVFSVVFSPDSKRLASAGSEGTVKVWDAGTGQELSTLKGLTDKVGSVAFSPDGKRLAGASRGPFGGWSGELKVWDAQTGQELLLLQGKNAGFPCNVVFSPDGRRLASGINFGPGEAGVVQVWDAQTGAKLLTLQGHTHAVRSVAFSPDGNRLASGAGQGTNSYPVETQPGETKVWDAETGQELLTFNGSSFYHCVAFSPDGHHLASNAGGPVKIYDATPLPENP